MKQISLAEITLKPSGEQLKIYNFNGQLDEPILENFRAFEVV